MKDDISILRIKAFRQIPLNRIFAYPVILTDKVPTIACLDTENRIYMNPQRLEAITGDPVESPLLSDLAVTAFLHEVLHDVLDHFPRRDVFLGQEPTHKQLILWNLASDVVVNELLMQWTTIAQAYRDKLVCLDAIEILPNNMPLVVEVIYRYLYKNTHVEATTYKMKLGSNTVRVYDYKIVKGPGPDQIRDLGDIDATGRGGSESDQSQDQGQGQDSQNTQNGQGQSCQCSQSMQGNGGQKPSSGKVIYRDIAIEGSLPGDKRRKSQFKYAFPELVEALKQAGKEAGDLEKELEIIKSPVDLTGHLNKYFDNIKAGLDDISFLRMSRLDYMLMSLGYEKRLKLPSYISRTVRTVIGIDSSGSISDNEYRDFISTIWKHKNMLEGKVVICDYQVQGILDLRDSKESELKQFLTKRKGYGGTSYKPVFEIAERENVEVVIYFTDLFPDEFPQNPKFKVLWVVKLTPETFSVSVPYGTVIWF